MQCDKPKRRTETKAHSSPTDVTFQLGYSANGLINVIHKKGRTMASLCNDSDFEEPTPEPKKKPRIWVWVVITAAIVVCFGVGAVGISTILNTDNATEYQNREEDEDENITTKSTDENNNNEEDNLWETVMDSAYGDRHITDPDKLTMENYASEDDYLNTFRIQDGDVVEDVTNGGMADGGNISQEFLDSAVDFLASVANEPNVEVRSNAQDTWLENIEETTDFGQRLFYQWEGNMSMLFAPVKYARDNVVYFMENRSDSPDVTELAKDILIMDLNTNRLLHYKSAQ